MTYHNDLNPAGVTVDGVPDTVSLGAIQWEMVTGAQGSLVAVGSVYTDIPGFTYTSYYSDDTTPSVTQCTGDDFEYATSGLWIDVGIPNTDPSQGTYDILESTRVVYYESPGQTTVDAELRFDQATTPLALATAPLPEAPDCDDGLDNDGDGTTDHPEDPGCADASDASEKDETGTYPCDDGVDNDGDGSVDAADPACSSGNPYAPDPTAPRERTFCQDGADNDGDGFIDWDGGGSAGVPPAQQTDPDPECVDKPWQNMETYSPRRSYPCGLGAELALLLPPLMWMRRRRR
jgi:hypothetical protein